MGFWKFGKKKMPPAAKDVTGIALETGAFIIHLQLKPASGFPGFDEALHSAFVRGYLTGVFTGAMQAFNVAGYGDNSKTMAFIVGGHIQLLGESQGFSFAMDSVSLQGNRDYDLGNRLGGQDLVDFLNKKTKIPHQLLNYFRGN